jgi:hypothetical protein
MVALIIIAVAGLFAAVVIAAIIGVVSLAVRREDKHLTLTSEATDAVTRAGRWLIGVYVRAPRRVIATAAGPPTTRA